jgi:hypothetical protein
MRIAAGALLYFAVVFSVAFMFGTVRVIWLEPQFGRATAEICEAPLLLITMAFASRWVPRVLHLRRDLKSLGLMGLGALALQQGADLAVGVYLRGITPAQQLANFATVAGLIYAALLIAFTAMPLLSNSDALTAARKI